MDFYFYLKSIHSCFNISKVPCQCFYFIPDWEDSGPEIPVQREGGQADGTKHWDWDTAENARTKERMKKIMKDNLK